MQDKGPDECQRDGDTPHTDDQAVHVEQGITAAVQHAVDRDGIDTAADHVEGHDHHHSCQIAPCLICQYDHAHDKRCHGQHQGSGEKTDDIGNIFELDPVGFTQLQTSGSQLIAYDDAGGTANAVAHTADQVSGNRGDGICRCGVGAHMAHDRGIGGKADTPA